MARLRLFGPAREQAGVGRAELPGGTAGAVLDEATARFGPRFGAIAATSRIWVNGTVADRSTPVGADDEVAVLPPVSGG